MAHTEAQIQAARELARSMGLEVVEPTPQRGRRQRWAKPDAATQVISGTTLRAGAIGVACAVATSTPVGRFEVHSL